MTAWCVPEQLEDGGLRRGRVRFLLAGSFFSLLRCALIDRFLQFLLSHCRSGEDALAMERCSDAEVLAATRGILRRFPAALAGLPASWDVSAQAAGGRVVRSRFGEDPFLRGSYSYLGVGAGPEDVAALLEPIPGSGGGSGGGIEGGLVLLAGEACNVKYIGCAHAASTRPSIRQSCS